MEAERAAEDLCSCLEGADGDLQCIGVGGGEQRAHFGHMLKAEPRESMHGLDLSCKALLETLSSHGFQDNTLLVVPSHTGHSISHFFPEPSSCSQHQHMERPTAKSSRRPGISSLLALCSLGSLHPVPWLECHLYSDNSQLTSLADFSPEFQNHSTCCLADRSIWVCNRHLKLHMPNACSFHTHLHLSI